MSIELTCKLIDLNVRLLEQQVKTVKLLEKNIDLGELLLRLLAANRAFVLEHITEEEITEAFKPVGGVEKYESEM